MSELGDLVFLAFAGLLILLRFDAHRFGTAEYDDEDSPGGWRDDVRRLTWYALGIALIAAIYVIHPRPVGVFRLTFGTERAFSVAAGLAFGSLGTAVAVAFAVYRYGRFRLPAPGHYPRALLNSMGTAFIDEAAFRGIVMGALLAFGWPLHYAIAFQAMLYALATRLGAPGRSRTMLVIFLAVGAIAGWLTWATGGIAAAFLGHAITRFAFFVCTGHAGQIEVSGYEPEELAGQDLPPQGWHVVDELGRRRWVEAGYASETTGLPPESAATGAARAGTVTRAAIEGRSGAERRPGGGGTGGAERRVGNGDWSGTERRGGGPGRTAVGPRPDRERAGRGRGEGWPQTEP